MTRQSTSEHLRQFEWYRRSRLWVVPMAGVAIAMLLATATLTIDHVLVSPESPFPVFTGTTDTSRSLLSLIATSIATLTALVLTIIAVVIQLATQALSPRAVRTFLQDLHSHLTVGTFIATFTYALVVLWQLSVLSTDTDDRVGSISVTVAFVLAVVSIGMFISYVDHIVHQARVTSIIDRIADETRHAIDRQYGHDGDAQSVEASAPERDPDHVVRAAKQGVVLEIDVDAVVDRASELDVLVVLVPSIGDFIPTQGRVLQVYGDRAAEADDLLDRVEIDAERSIAQDIPFGFRLLIDIAERSLSAGINDPTTATHVVDQLHDLLLLLGRQQLSRGWHADQDGDARLAVAEPDWDLYVALAFEEIRHYGADSLQIMRRMRAAADDLRRELPRDRHPALQRQCRLLDATIDNNFATEPERAAARHPDAQGIGSGGGFAPEDPTDLPEDEDGHGDEDADH